MNNQHLRQLRLRKFRSHENLELKFDSNFIFFSGPNGIGKTNILEAISLFSPGRGLRFASIDELRSDSGSGNWNVFSVFEVERELMEKKTVDLYWNNFENYLVNTCYGSFVDR